MNQPKISIRDKLLRNCKHRCHSRKESVASTQVTNSEYENTKELPMKNLFDISFMEEKDSFIYNSFNTITTSTTAYTPSTDPRFKIKPKEVMLDTNCFFLTTSFDSKPVKLNKRKAREKGIYKVWHKIARQRHSDITDTFLDHYKRTYKDSWTGVHQGVKEVIPLRLNTSAIAEHRWTKLSTHIRAQSSHYEPNPINKPSFSFVNQPELIEIINNLKDTEKELTNPTFSVAKLRRVKARFRRSAEQHKENITTKRAAPIIQIESSPAKSRNLERVLIPSSRIEI